MKRSILFLGFSLLLLTGALPAHAQQSWAVAEREPEQIATLVGKLRPYVEKLDGVDEAGGAILYRQLQYDASEDGVRACRNLVMELRDPATVVPRLLSPWVRMDQELEGAFAFVLRDGTVESLPEEAVHFEPGVEEIGRGRVGIDWPELHAGDVIGWSVVTRADGPGSPVEVAAADVYPTVIANLTLRGNGRYVFEVRPGGLEPSEVETKRQELRDGRAMVVKASVKSRPPVEDVPEGDFLPDTVPHLTAYLSEVWVESDSPMFAPGWASATGWNSIAIGLAGLIDAQAEKMKGTDIVLAAVTTGKTTPRDKAAAVCRYVRDKFELLDGPEYMRDGVRDPQEVFRAKKGTAVELALVTAVLMEQAGVPVSLALLRDPALGAFDPEWSTREQISDVVVRTGPDEDPSWWAPQCKDCEPGELPPSWRGVQAVTWPADLAEMAKAHQEKMREKAMREGRFDLAAAQAEIASQPWHRIETVAP